MQFAYQIISALVQMCHKVNQERQNRGSWAAWEPIWILYAVHYVFKTNCECGQKITISNQNHLTGYNYKIDYRNVRQNFLFLCIFRVVKWPRFTWYTPGVWLTHCFGTACILVCCERSEVRCNLQIIESLTSKLLGHFCAHRNKQ